MKPTIALTICLLLISTAVVCGVEDPPERPRPKTVATPDTTRPPSSAFQSIKQRLQGTTAPTTVPTVVPTAVQQPADQQPTDQHPTDRVIAPTAFPTSTPSAEAPGLPTVDLSTSEHYHLLPPSPEYDEQTLLDRIYDQVDLEVFALDPAHGIPNVHAPGCTLTAPESTPGNSGIGRYWNRYRCEPYRIDPRIESMDIHPPYAEEFLPPSFMAINTSPIEVTNSHPYRFAFKNTHILATHTDNQEQITMAANYLPAVRGFRNEENIIAAYRAEHIVPARGLVGIEDWIHTTWNSPYHDMASLPAPESMSGQLHRAVASILEEASQDIQDSDRFFIPTTDHVLHPNLTSYVTAPYRHPKDEFATWRDHFYDPVINWEIISPTLPILRVTTYSEIRLPLLHIPGPLRTRARRRILQGGIPAR